MAFSWDEAEPLFEDALWVASMERKVPTGAFANSIATPPPNPSRDQGLGTSFVEVPGPWYHLAKKEPTD